MTDQHVACELCAPPEPTTSAASVARPRVLVIDDEEAIRSALGRAAGHASRTAGQRSAD